MAGSSSNSSTSSTGSSSGRGVCATRDQEASPSPPFEPPTYSITMGSDKTLQWHPPVDSQELAWALSYHFPKPSSLEGKMRAAMADFFKQRRKSSPPGPAPNEPSPPPSLPWSAGAERTLRHVRGEVSSARVLSRDQRRAQAKSQAQQAAQSQAQNGSGSKFCWTCCECAESGMLAKSRDMDTCPTQSLAQSSLAQSSLAQSSLAQSSLAQSSLAQSSLAQSQAQSSLAQARPSFAQAQAPPAHDKPKAPAQRPAKFSSFFPGMSTFRLENGERHPVKPRKRPYSEQERAQVARNRGNVCSFHKKRKQKCDPKNCHNRQSPGRSPASSSPRSLRGGSFHPPSFQTQPTDLPPRLTGGVPEQPEQSDWQAPEQSDWQAPEQSDWQAPEQSDWQAPDQSDWQAPDQSDWQAPYFQLENCQPWVTQLSLSSSQSSYLPTNTSLSEADSRPSRSFTTVSELPGAADERHKAVPTVSDPSNSPWDPVQKFLDSNDDPYMDGLELEEPSFEDPLPFDQYINIPNNFEYLDALHESCLEHVGRRAADSGIVGHNLGDLRNPAKSMEGLKELHCGSLKIFLDTVTPAPDEDTPPVHSVPTTAKLTPRAKESESLTRPPIPAGAELSPAGVKIMAQLQAPTGGGHGQYDCDRGLVDPYPHPPVTTCRERLVHDLSPNGLIRRCSTVSTASTRHSYGRELCDGGLILGAGGVVRRISSTSQSSRPTSNCGQSSLSRHCLDDIRRRGSHNSATSSCCRREDATGLRRGDSVGRSSLYGTAGNPPHSPRSTDHSGSEALEKTMDILVSKMSGTRIHV